MKRYRAASGQGAIAVETWILTEINSKVKIHCVDGLFVGPSFLTEVWISEKAQKVLLKFHWRASNIGQRFVRSLKHYAEVGFASFEGDEGTPIRHEDKGVYRIAHSRSLFRLIGFYEGAGKRAFIVMDGFTKSGQKLKESERQRIKETARIRDNNLWAKRDELDHP